MDPIIKNILYTTDLSKNSAYVFRYAVNTAKMHDARLHILNVFESSPSVDATVLMFMGRGDLDQLKHNRKEQITKIVRERIEKFIAVEFSKEPDVTGHIGSIIAKVGDPVTEILQAAEKLDSDVIIMGTHSKGPVDHAFLGSTAEKVIRRTRRPVYIIPVPPGDLNLPNI